MNVQHGLGWAGPGLTRPLQAQQSTGQSAGSRGGPAGLVSACLRWKTTQSRQALARDLAAQPLRCVASPHQWAQWVHWVQKTPPHPHLLPPINPPALSPRNPQPHLQQAARAGGSTAILTKGISAEPPFSKARFFDFQPREFVAE